MRYIAVDAGLKFGDRVLAPGDEVPIEPGRNYRGLLRRRQIAIVPDDGSGDAGSGKPKAARGRKAPAKTASPSTDDGSGDAGSDD